MTHTEALRLALDALQRNSRHLPVDFDYHFEAIAACRAALAAPSVPSGEPVAWWIPKAEQFCIAKPNGERPFAKAWQPLYATPQPAPAGWRPIETAPQTGCKIVLAYVNRNGRPRTVMARWLTDEQAAETDADGVGLEGGWYECIDNWDDYTEVAIHEGEPSHWMPLPAAPTAPAGGAAHGAPNVELSR